MAKKAICFNCGKSTLHRSHIYATTIELCSLCDILYANGHPFWGGDCTVRDKIQKAIKEVI